MRDVAKAHLLERARELNLVETTGVVLIKRSEDGLDARASTA